jgi:hypothetical protein
MVNQMTTEIELVDLVDSVISDTHDANLPLLAIPLTEAFAIALTHGMSDVDRTKLIVEIAAIVSSRINLYKKARHDARSDPENLVQ